MKLTTTEIKKALYKQKPEAKMAYAKKGMLRYISMIIVDEITTTVRFEIPFEDMGDAMFEPKMPAQLLNRWIVN